MSILDEYFMTYPKSQNAIDIFHGEWSSIIPGDIKSNGNADLFNDARIDLICNKVGGLTNANILELGPLEGGHSYMLTKKLKAKSVTAIEANSRAYLKCLIVKEMLEMNNVSFMLGDFDQYLNDCNIYDLILACGVIYHCKNPIETIVKISNKTQKIGIWSHYFKESEVRSIYGDRFSYVGEIMNYKGFTGTVYKHNYSKALNIPRFCGGGNTYTYWMDLESWFSLFGSLGFTLEILSGSENHIHGPEFTAIATRK